jgi:signal transduction histidine kinase
VTKHSRATRVQVVVREHPALYQLRIQDNGKKDARCAGDFPERTEGSGIGLQNMRDRVEALQGHIQISRDRGFGIFITIPKEVR